MPGRCIICSRRRWRDWKHPGGTPAQLSTGTAVVSSLGSRAQGTCWPHDLSLESESSFNWNSFQQNPRRSEPCRSPPSGDKAWEQSGEVSFQAQLGHHSISFVIRKFDPSTSLWGKGQSGHRWGSLVKVSVHIRQQELPGRHLFFTLCHSTINDSVLILFPRNPAGAAAGRLLGCWS